ncbi:MAG: MFS transporter [Opitutaceae bacterium]|nr:MFS transporter [Opitutaceae bacterium]
MTTQGTQRVSWKQRLRQYRWLIVGLLFVTAVVNNLDRQTLSVLAPTLRETLGISTVEYSYVVSSFLAAYTVGYLFAGSALDRLGVKLGLALAIAFWSLASGLHILATGWFGLAVMRFLLGLGESFNTPAAIKAIAEWVPSRERGLCVAIYNNGFVVGSILAPPFVSLIALHFGWHWSFILTAILGAMLLYFWWKFYDSPETSSRLSESERAYILESRASEEENDTLSLWRLVRHPVCAAFIVSRFLTDCFSYFFNFWLPDYFQTARGFSLALLGMVGWIPYLLADIGGPVGGAVSDWLVRRGWNPLRARLRLMLLSALLMPLGIAAVHTDDAWLSLGLLSIMYAAQMCWMVNQLSILSECFPRKAVARVIAATAVGGGIGGIMATVLTGRAVASYGYVPVFTAMSVLHVTAFAVVAWAMRASRSSPKLSHL